MSHHLTEWRFPVGAHCEAGNEQCLRNPPVNLPTSSSNNPLNLLIQAHAESLFFSGGNEKNRI